MAAISETGHAARPDLAHVRRGPVELARLLCSSPSSTAASTPSCTPGDDCPPPRLARRRSTLLPGISSVHALVRRVNPPDLVVALTYIFSPQQVRISRSPAPLLQLRLSRSSYFRAPRENPLRATGHSSATPIAVSGVSVSLPPAVAPPLAISADTYLSPPARGASYPPPSSLFPLRPGLSTTA